MTTTDPAATAGETPDGAPLPRGARAVGDSPAVSAVSAAVSLASRRQAVAACRRALDGLRDVLVACTDRDLVALAGQLAEVRALAGAGVVAVTAEAEERGLVGSSQFASTAAWVADAAWHSRREAATIAKAAALLRQSGYEPVADAVCSGDVDLSSAVACGREFAKLEPDLAEVAKPIVLEHMVDVAGEHGPAAVRQLKDEILARYGDEGSFEELCERRRRHIELSAGRHTAAGMWEYRLTVDGEGRAVLEAAIGPGSAPKPAAGAAEGDCRRGGGPADGVSVTTRDMRPVGQRRGEELIDALRRSVTAVGRGVPAASPKAIVMLTMDYGGLVERIRTRRAWFGRYRGPAGYGNSECGGPAGAGSGTGTAVASGGAGPGQPGTGTAVASGGAGPGQPGTAPAVASGGAGPGLLHTGPSVSTDEWRARLRRVAETLPTARGPATVLASRAGGELISPGTVRRIACDAGIIPVVLGGQGELLDQGRMMRLFTPGQVRALWRRDRHCSFPDCDVPAAWCDAHHLVHWVDGGETALSNAALLCPRHHTIVHRDDLAGAVVVSGTDGSRGETGSRGKPAATRDCSLDPPMAAQAAQSPHVEWDRRPGSYGAAVSGSRTERLSA